jgi:hypothetical protein
MRERAPAFRSADHNADSACKPRQRAPADQAGEVAAPDHSWAIEVSTADGHSWRNGVRPDTKAEARSLHPDARRLRDGRLCNWPGHSLRWCYELPRGLE